MITSGLRGDEERDWEVRSVPFPAGGVIIRPGTRIRLVDVAIQNASAMAEYWHHDCGANKKWQRAEPLIAPADSALASGQAPRLIRD